MRAGLLCGAGVLVALALAGGGGSRYGPLVGLGCAAIVVAGVVVILACLGRVAWPRLDPPGAAFAALLGALVVWTGVSVAWSIAPDHSWEYFNRGAVYVAFFLLGVFVAAAVPGAPRTVAIGFGVVLTAVMAWALAGKVVPNLFPDGARIARLRDPIEYWNGLALIAAMAMPIGLWLAVRPEHARRTRTAAVVLLYLAGVTLLLTYSRGGVVVALVTLAVSVMLFPQRVEAAAAMALAFPPGRSPSPASPPTSSRTTCACATGFSSGLSSCSWARPSRSPRTSSSSVKADGGRSSAGSCRDGGSRWARPSRCCSPSWSRAAVSPSRGRRMAGMNSPTPRARPAPAPSGSATST